MRLLIASLLLLVSPVLAHEGGHAPAQIVHKVSTEAKPWTSLDINNAPSKFHFAVVTDNAGGPRPGIFAEAVSKINLIQPEFVMSIGDFIEGYEDTKEALDRQWDVFMQDVAGFEMPFFFVPGNHDVGRPLWAEVYKERFGVPYFHFTYKDVLFLCLNTNDAPDAGTGIGEEQIAYVAKTLEEHPDVQWTLVFQHKPLWNDRGAKGWPEVEALLRQRNTTVFAGHTHNYLNQEDEGISFITMATTGGGSRLRGPAFGEFDGVVWVTMTEEDGPRVANLLLDGILDRSLRTPETAEELALFRADRAVTATPILFDGPQFTEGTTTVTITNPSPQPLRIQLLSQTGAGIRLEPSSIEGVIPGGSEHVQELRLTADGAVPAPAMQPVVLHWQAYYDHEDNTPSTKLAGQLRVPVDAPFTIPERSTAPAIDGKLDDWEDLPFVVTQPGEIFQNPPAWKGPGDGQYRFGVARDADYLYVAVDAQDDESHFEGWKYWEDFVMLQVDPRGMEGGDPRAAIFSVISGPGMSREQAAEYEVGSAPEGVRQASAATETGFAVEFAIPLASLDQHQGGAWSRLRLNIGFSDFDTTDMRDGVSILYWRPQWTSPHTYPESGVFLRDVQAP